MPENKRSIVYQYESLKVMNKRDETHALTRILNLCAEKTITNEQVQHVLAKIMTNGFLWDKEKIQALQKS